MPGWLKNGTGENKMETMHETKQLIGMTVAPAHLPVAAVSHCCRPHTASGPKWPPCHPFLKQISSLWMPTVWGGPSISKTLISIFLPFSLLKELSNCAWRRKAAKALCVAAIVRMCCSFSWTVLWSPPQRDEPQETTEPSVLGSSDIQQRYVCTS